jgi:hypothetical protein
MKNVMFFFPGNLFLNSDGCHFRALQILNYLLDQDYKVDVVIINNIGGWQYSNNHFTHPNMNVYVLENSKVEKFQKALYFCNLNIAFSPIAMKIKDLSRINNYDAAVIAYATYAYLVPVIRNKIKKIVCDTQDFLSLSAIQKSFISYKDIGSRLSRELKYLSEFDILLNISEYENYFFSSFLKNKSYVVTPYSNDVKCQEYEIIYDIIYVGSDNAFNIKSINWFLREVYPHVRNLKLAIVGNVYTGIEKSLLTKNIDILGRVNDISEIYSKSKIAICPMIGGTGLKIKIIEALTYNKPVIASSVVKYGLIGNYEDAVYLASNEEEFVNYLHDINSFLEKNNVISYRDLYLKDTFYTKLDMVFNCER